MYITIILQDTDLWIFYWHTVKRRTTPIWLGTHYPRIRVSIVAMQTDHTSGIETFGNGIFVSRTSDDNIYAIQSSVWKFSRNINAICIIILPIVSWHHNVQNSNFFFILKNSGFLITNFTKKKNRFSFTDTKKNVFQHSDSYKI